MSIFPNNFVVTGDQFICDSCVREMGSTDIKQKKVFYRDSLLKWQTYYLNQIF